MDGRQYETPGPFGRAVEQAIADAAQETGPPRPVCGVRGCALAAGHHERAGTPHRPIITSATSDEDLAVHLIATVYNAMMDVTRQAHNDQPPVPLLDFDDLPEDAQRSVVNGLTYPLGLVVRYGVQVSTDVAGGA